ncbi:hypothetical protein ACFYPB_44630 [Streptomyces olivaceoviridis]|uniref:hypothetical protein n=1 Tax=Streptomyces olivaceoviridis TaxID=1921 RepID=UPI0036BF1BB9
MSLLVMDRVILVPEWRGAGLGPVLAGTAIRRLPQDCTAVACEPASADGHEMTDEQHRQAATKLGQLWSAIGFESLNTSEQAPCPPQGGTTNGLAFRPGAGALSEARCPRRAGGSASRECVALAEGGLAEETEQTYAGGVTAASRPPRQARALRR